MAEEDRARAYREMLAASNLTARMLERQVFATFDRDRAPEACDALEAFAARPSGWVVLSGKVGTGKTHLLVATARALLDAGHRPLYVIVPNFMDYLRAGIKGGEVDGRVDQARQAEVLLLDDLGAEAETDWASDKFFQIINDRYNAGAPTVFTTNLLLRQLPPRLASRLQDIALSQVFVLVGDDYRTSPDRVADRAHDEGAGR